MDHDSQPIRILLIETDPGEAERVQVCLRETRQFVPSIEWVTSLESGLSLLGSDSFDAAIIDLDLSGASGAASIGHLLSVTPELAVIAISANGSDSAMEASYAAGAQDFILKADLSPQLLSRSVRYAVERHRAQDRQRRLERAVVAMPDAVIVSDLDGVARFVNDAALALFGKRREEIEGQLLGFSVQPGNFVEVEIFRGREPRTAEMRVADFQWDGKPAWLATLRDTTEMHNIEEQIRQAQKMQAIGQLAGGIAHDFNNLISVINGYADFAVQAMSEDDGVRNDIEQIRVAGDRAAKLTQQLLAFSRKQILRPEILDLGTIVTQQKRFLSPLIGEHISFNVVVPDTLGRVAIDRGQIEQVIMNLAVNARDAMQRGGKLTIELKNVDLDKEFIEGHYMVAPGAYVMIAVSDTGAGMDRVTLSRVFEPFFTTKERGKGTGLGLSTVYGIIKQSGGYVFVYSERNKGTVFKIYLPRVEDKRTEVQEADGDKPITGVERVLLVEDEDSLRLLIERILKSVGYTVFAVRDADSAFDVLRSTHNEIDLLLTDVILPGMSGPDLVARLKPTMKNLKILYMSGYTDDTIIRHGVLGFGTDFIGKPFTSRQLQESVRSVLDQKAQ